MAYITLFTDGQPANVKVRDLLNPADPGASVLSIESIGRSGVTLGIHATLDELDALAVKIADAVRAARIPVAELIDDADLADTVIIDPPVPLGDETLSIACDSCCGCGWFDHDWQPSMTVKVDKCTDCRGTGKVLAVVATAGAGA